MSIESYRYQNTMCEKLTMMGITNSAVLDAMRSVPRHKLVDSAFPIFDAYKNSALPIGYGQTISQPYVVALMCQTLLEQGVTGKVLEIGTGSGYQALVMSRLFREVFSIERIKPLFDLTAKRLEGIKPRNCKVRFGDGAEGWSSFRPFDAVVFTAATSYVPEALRNQLSAQGIVLAPVSHAQSDQRLTMFHRNSTTGELEPKELCTVRFVPFVNGVTQ